MTLTLYWLCVILRIPGTQAGMAALITHLCASTCAFTWMVIEWLHLGKPSIVGDDFSFACVCHCCIAGSEHGLRRRRLGSCNWSCRHYLCVWLRRPHRFLRDGSPWRPAVLCLRFPQEQIRPGPKAQHVQPNRRVRRARHRRHDGFPHVGETRLFVRIHEELTHLLRLRLSVVNKIATYSSGESAGILRQARDRRSSSRWSVLQASD
jgi:hypothetical protein